jgi:peptidoglycan hydrolase-like protein with peptidoglycan-binding domain
MHQVGAPIKVAAALALALAVSVAVPAAPAAAATPQCTKGVDHLPDSAAGGLRVPAASNNSRLCWMSLNNESGGVSALQRGLRYCYAQDIAIDGNFGPRTRDALRRVQGRVGAQQDGVYGPETARKMKFSHITSTSAQHCSWQTF